MPREPASAWLLNAAIALVLMAAPAGASAADLQNGEEINEVCAGCHGDLGQGGKEGEYPRLAGQPAAFLVRQLELFRARQRPNLAMVEYVDHRQMPDPDIADIAAYLDSIELPTRLPPVDESAPDYNALERLLEAKKVVQIPRAEGDVEAGRKLYRKECGSCHGRDGWGDRNKAVPMLTGQYTNYLWRQVDKYLAGVRIHDPEAPEDRLLAEFSRGEMRDIFAYVSTLDD
jgi:cytochrome c553